VQLLLDTHALIWWFLDDKRLSRKADLALADEGNTIFVSAASAWEIATKHRIGKLPGVTSLAADIGGAIAGQGFAALPIRLQHGQLAGALPGPHGDPFDRMLAAQALTENLTLITRDDLVAAYGPVVAW